MTPTPLQQTLCNGLLYGLKYQYDNGRNDALNGIYNVIPEGLRNCISDPHKKPILFPLDMLDKEIEINGERFVPIDEFFVMYGGGIKEAKVNWKKDFMDNILYTPFGKLDFDIIQKLIEWHFNVFQLPEGDYIPVTDNFNPYK